MIVAGTFKCFSILSKNRKRVYWEEFPSTCSKYISISESWDWSGRPKIDQKIQDWKRYMSTIWRKKWRKFIARYVVLFSKTETRVLDPRSVTKLLCTLVRRISVHYRETAVYLNGLEWITPVKKWSENFMFLLDQWILSNISLQKYTCFRQLV